MSLAEHKTDKLADGPFQLEDTEGDGGIGHRPTQHGVYSIHPHTEESCISVQGLTPSQVSEYGWLHPTPAAWEVFQAKGISGQQGTGMKAKNLSTKQVILLVLRFQAPSIPLQA